jgi:hypothetical protein
MDPDHPSEALLPTFDHDAVSVALQLTPHPSMVGAFALLGTLGGAAAGLASMALGLEIALVTAVGTAGLMALMGLWLRRRVRVVLDGRAITITDQILGRDARTRSIALRDVRTAHAVDTGQGQGQSHRGLRLALDDGEEVFFGAASVPVAALEWLAAEIRGVAGRARSEPIGEVAPELVELVSEESRKRIEAARRASAARRQTG